MLTDWPTNTNTESSEVTRGKLNQARATAKMCAVCSVLNWNWAAVDYNLAQISCVIIVKQQEGRRNYIFFQYEIIKLEFSGIVLLTHAEWKPDKNI